MRILRRCGVVVAALLGGLWISASAGRALAACPGDCPLKGGGKSTVECNGEFASTKMKLNFPPFNPAKPKPGKEVRCFDGDPGCDLDGQVNQSCQFDVDVCLRNADTSLPSCTPSDVTAAVVSKASGDPELGPLQTALAGLLPATTNVCTTGQSVTVALKGPDAKGTYKRTSRTVKITATSAAGTDSNKVKFTCVPHGWPSHGYDHRNTRAQANETILGPGNASQLVQKWNLDLQAAIGGGNNGVTATPTVAGNVVYVTSWNGFVVAVNAKNGKIKWKYDTGSAGVLGVQSSATLTPDGRLLVGDSGGTLHCLLAKNGQVLWTAPLAALSSDHIWGSPTVVGNKVFIGIASHSDVPCTQGRLVAVDLDTGATLWNLKTVPDKICDNDTSISCTSNLDCGVGSCVTARGAGVTASVSSDTTGDAIFMNTVGCYTFPSIGDSDSIFRIDAETGAVTWKVRVQAPEQFQTCTSVNPASCRCTTTDANCLNSGDCGGAMCVSRAFYHDFGALNGPLFVNASDGMAGTRDLVVTGSKDGSLYARDPVDGSAVWTNVLRPAPVSPAFAGFGLFDGAVGFAGDRFFAALYDFIPALAPAPKHLMAFSAVDGTMAWEDEIGISWGSVALGGGLLATGTLAASEVYVYDATSGSRLATLTLPSTVSSGPSIVDGTLYVGYGIFGAAGGVAAYGLP